MLKKIFIIIMICAICMASNMLIVLAINTEELEQQKDAIDEQINQTQNQIQQVEEIKSELINEIQKLTEEITSYETQIDSLDVQIKEVEAKIAETEIKLAEAEAKCAYQNEMLQKRIVAMYEAGETTFLDVLLNSKDISDFVTNYYIVSEIAKIDQELLTQLEKSKDEIEEAKRILSESKQEIEEIKKEQETKANQLKNAQLQKQTKANQLTEEEKALQEQLNQFEADKNALQEQIDEILSGDSGNIISNPGTPSSYGYIFPVQGLSINNINNTNYPSYSGHTGTDININVVGKNVVAVKDGTVEISRALYGSIPTYNYSGEYLGSYRSYGEYILINHHDGTMTLYAHLYPGSRRVSAGDTVVQGQIIGTVGNTGNCLPRPTPSSPLNGTHLHFEVRLNGQCVNPIPYLR